MKLSRQAAHKVLSKKLQIALLSMDMGGFFIQKKNFSQAFSKNPATYTKEKTN